MTHRIILLCLVLFIISTALVIAQEQGEKQILIHGGKQGNISFPHHAHQSTIKDCMVCHTDFPQEPGALQASKKAGLLKNKQVMNETCLKCHKDRKKEGQTSGPVKCSGCHVKN